MKTIINGYDVECSVDEFLQLSKVTPNQDVKVLNQTEFVFRKNDRTKGYNGCGAKKYKYSYKDAQSRLYSYKGPFVEGHYIRIPLFASIIDGRTRKQSNGTITKFMDVIERGNVRFLRCGFHRIAVDYDDGDKALDALKKAGYLE